MLLTAVLSAIGYGFYLAMLEQGATYPVASAFMGTLMVTWVFCFDLWVPEVERYIVQKIKQLFWR